MIDHKEEDSIGEIELHLRTFNDGGTPLANAIWRWGMGFLMACYLGVLIFGAISVFLTNGAF